MKSFTIEFHVKLVASWVILRLMRTSYSVTMLQTKRDWVNMKSFIFEFHVKLVVFCVFFRRRWPSTVCILSRDSAGLGRRWETSHRTQKQVPQVPLHPGGQCRKRTNDPDPARTPHQRGRRLQQPESGSHGSFRYQHRPTEARQLCGGKYQVDLFQ